MIDIVRVLPLNQVEQLVDFANFLKAQFLTEQLLEEETSVEIEADNAQWDALLATNESQTLLEQLAAEALTEHRADKTKPIAFNEDGRIVPECSHSQLRNSGSSIMPS